MAHLIMAPSPIADQVDDHVLPEHLTVSEGDIDCPSHGYTGLRFSSTAKLDHTFWVVAVDMQNRTTDHLA